MPAKRKPKKAASSEEEDAGSSSDSGDYSPPPKKKAAPRRKPTPKKKAQAAAGAAADAPAGSNEYDSAEGFHIVEPGLIWRDWGTEPGDKIAAFDLDGTLVVTKTGKPFPNDASDWRFWNKQVVKDLKKLHKDGYKIVIFTNQGSIKTALQGKASTKVQQRCRMVAEEILAKAGAPVQIFIAPAAEATGDPRRKPGTGMWDFMLARANGGMQPDLAECFFVGDADGSKGSIGDSDKLFAKNVGIAYETPTQRFGECDAKKLDEEGIAEGKAMLEDGSHPNAELIQQFKDYAAQIFENISSGTAAPNAQWAAVANKKVADALTGFMQKVTEANLSAVNKLKGVGAGSMEKIRRYLKTGLIVDPEEDGTGYAARSPAAATPKKPKAATEAAKFM